MDVCIPTGCSLLVSLGGPSMERGHLLQRKNPCLHGRDWSIHLDLDRTWSYLHYPSGNIKQILSIHNVPGIVPAARKCNEDKTDRTPALTTGGEGTQ